MIAILQRVNSASLYIYDNVNDPQNKLKYSSINEGLLILIGIANGDTEQDINYLIDKIKKLRIFNDSDGKMNLSISDIGGDIMAVSQFTLLANLKKGRRPSFINASKPEKSEILYNLFIKKLKELPLKIKTGKFGANMDIELINNGPATFILDSNN